MTLRKKQFQNLVLLGLIIALFVGCENEFIDLDSDLINNDVATNFNVDSIQYDVVSYTVPFGPVQTNGLPMNYLGVFNDPNYGKSAHSFVSQLNYSTVDPDFGDNTELDSVILYIPYFSTALGINDDGILEYDVDSVFGSGPFKLSIYESDYFMRAFDPNGEFGDQQVYFSNRSTSPTDLISEDILMGTEILPQEEFQFENAAIYLTDNEGDTTQVLSPGIRMKLDSLYWKEKIIDMEGSAELSNVNNFYEYFRGIYFKAESDDPNGSLLGLNLNNVNASITLFYTRDPFTEGDDREQATFELRFGDIAANFTDNNFNVTIPTGDAEEGDERLYLKGNEGSRASIKLFDGFDDEGTSIFEKFKRDFANYEDGEFVSYKRLINEARLVVYVDQEMVNGEEPDRLYIYDVPNRSPLSDYARDGIVQNNPSFSVATHLGELQREGDEPDGAGIKYTLRITNHIINLIESDSTNVELGLAVSSNVNLESVNNQGFVQTTDESEQFIPLSAILSPRGTVLHGNKSNNPEKRLYLEIFYTCLETDEDCDAGN